MLHIWKQFVPPVGLAEALSIWDSRLTVRPQQVSLQDFSVFYYIYVSIYLHKPPKSSCREASSQHGADTRLHALDGVSADMQSSFGKRTENLLPLCFSLPNASWQILAKISWDFLKHMAIICCMPMAAMEACMFIMVCSHKDMTVRRNPFLLHIRQQTDGTCRTFCHRTH